MAIHHDKLAYGKISSLREDFSEDRLIAMADRLSEGRKDPFPDYDRSIAGLACSLLRHFGVSLPQGEGTLPLADTCLVDEYDVCSEKEFGKRRLFSFSPRRGIFLRFSFLDGCGDDFLLKRSISLPPRLARLDGILSRGRSKRCAVFQ